MAGKYYNKITLSNAQIILKTVNATQKLTSLNELTDALIIVTLLHKTKSNCHVNKKWNCLDPPMVIEMMTKRTLDLELISWKQEQK